MSKLPKPSFVHRTLGRLVGAYMLFCGWTTRWERVNGDAARRVWASGKPMIACFWHGRITLTHVGWRQSEGAPRTLMLISQSKEGEAITQACQMVGLDVIRGSTDKAHKRKGGAEALRGMLRTLRAGGSVAITPDGPKGPRMRAQIGVIQLAKLSGAPLVCLGWATRGRKVFDSWDNFVLPLPFGRGAYVWGDPIHVARDADDDAMETARLALERELTRVAHEADRRVGVAPIEPAPAEIGVLEASPAA
jgi:lysophospholipid acyltransferase (LPLAT)-like uncharacterized protein